MTPTEPRGALEVDGAVVIVGAGLGGLRCAEALRASGFTGRISLVGDEPHPPYDRPPLTKQFLAGQWDDARLSLTKPGVLESLGLDLHLGASAASLDVAGRAVTLEDGRVLGGDAVVLATGAQPRWLPGTKGIAGIHVVRTLEQSAALRQQLASMGDDDRLVVVGGGFIGAEVASTAAAAGRRVTILEMLEVPLSTVVGDEVGRWLVALHEQAGVEVRGGVGVAGIAPAAPGSSLRVGLATGEELDAAVVVVGAGVRPATGWLDASGLELDDGVVTDASLFAADGVVAVGDLARFEWHHADSVEQVRIEHWEVTSQLAAHAATSLLAGRDRAPRVHLVPYFWSDQHGRKLQMLGHASGTDEATKVAGSVDEGRFTVLYHRAGRLRGVLGLSSPRNVMRLHDLVDRGAPIDEARALLGS